MKTIGLSVLLCFCFLSRHADGQEQKYGMLAGGFETNTIYYMKDAQTGAVRPDDRFGSNNYLNLDYSWRKFSIGVLFEGYLPVLQGFSGELKDCGIVGKYVAFEDRDLKLRVGDFYEQFGSGMVFRAYEERALGLNTSMEGVRLFYSFRDKISVKGIYGRPRRFMEHAASLVRGGDVQVNIGNLFDWTQTRLAVEGSFVNRYEEYVGNRDIESNVNAHSVRLAVEHAGFSLRGEYVGKSKDPALYNFYDMKKGRGVLLEAGYARKGMGIQVNFRSLERMVFRSSREATGLEEALNYLPALTRQHTYALANLYAYATQGNGETGGQVDFYYHFRKRTALGGKYGWKLQANFSTYYYPKDGFCSIGKELLYRDVNVDVTKKWSPAWKTVFFYSLQDFNPSVWGKSGDSYHSHIVVADATYAWRNRYSLRLEGQHLWTKQHEGNWVALSAELGIAPAWSFFATDMYNYGQTDIHYYNGGLSYSRSRTRVALQYGRNRSGIQCAGGVCREMPAYTGFNLTLTSSF
ncbi:MAG: hypothetical protein K2I90_08340 [Odoribacter sp.]|nr:hypothetical protein [Odoribacter sp.]